MEKKECGKSLSNSEFVIVFLFFFVSFCEMDFVVVCLGYNIKYLLFIYYIYLYIHFFFHFLGKTQHECTAYRAFTEPSFDTFNIRCCHSSCLISPFFFLFVLTFLLIISTFFLSFFFINISIVCLYAPSEFGRAECDCCVSSARRQKSQTGCTESAFCCTVKQGLLFFFF